jgi:hypothetical protein
MRRRDKTGGKEEKTQRRKTLKRRNATTLRLRSSAATAKKTNVARLARERDEALEQLAATSEVLQVISASPGELQPVFEAMLANAVRLCEAGYGAMWLREGNGFRNAAFHGALPEAYTGPWRSGMVIQPGPDVPLARTARSRTPVQIADLRRDRAYLEGYPLTVAAVDVAGVRTLLDVPMLKENELIGVISLYRQEVRPFTDKQVELVKNFAAQAVIAIENARLLNELRQSLEQQTATSEVLRVISGSATDLRPVFETTAHNSVNLCGATYGIVFRFDGEMISFVAHHNLDRAAIDALHQRFPMRPNTRALVGRTILQRDVLHVADAAADPTHTYTALNKPSVFGRFSVCQCCGTETRSVLSLCTVGKSDFSLIGKLSLSRRLPTKR